jgi:hypothetical protein
MHRIRNNDNGQIGILVVNAGINSGRIKVLVKG